MSIVIAIVPIDTKTENGTSVLVTGIDMTSGDPFRGEIEHMSGKFKPSRWQSNGMVRDGSPGWNLVLKNPELRDLYDVAKSLGARML